MTEVSAAQDFYQHVNAAWLEDPANAIPDDQTSWGGFVELSEQSLERQIQLARELTSLEGELAHRQKVVRAVWEASQQRFDNWEADKSDYSAILDGVSGLNRVILDNGDHEAMLARLYLHCQNHGLRNVLDFDKGSDLKCAEHVVLDLSAGGLSLPSREYYLDDKFRDKFEAWQQHLHRIQQLLIENTPDLELTDRWVERIVAFETRLAKYSMTPDQSRLYDEYFTNTTLTGVYEQINSLRSLGGKPSNYDDTDGDGMLNGEQMQRAKQFFEHVYRLLGLREIMQANRTRNFGDGPDGPDPFHVSVYDGDAVRRTLAEILNRDRLLDYQAYLQYGVVKAYATVCSRQLDSEWFDFYSRTLSGQAQPKSRDKRSIGTISGYAGELMGQIYVERYFPPEAKASVKSMIEEVLAIMRRSFGNSTWLTPNTAELALEKLAKFRVKIGYPDKWRDYSALNIEVGDNLATIRQKHLVWAIKHQFYDKINSHLDREEWAMTPQTVNAYFHPIQNEIVFPAAILQPPFFHQSFETVDFDCQEERQRLESDPTLALKAVNLGGIGAVIAHEITHGYDDQGRKFDCNGTLNDWWTPEDAEKFTQAAGLMIPQAEQYRFRHPDSGREYPLNPMLTMGENLADLGGLSLSAKVLEQSTDNVDYFRIFFKSFANIWKCNMRLETQINRLTTDPHSPAEFRANLVKNIDWFYRAFEVKPGDPMYLDPQQRLCMW